MNISVMLAVFEKVNPITIPYIRSGLEKASSLPQPEEIRMQIYRIMATLDKR
jgi:uncharacterized membrane protein